MHSINRAFIFSGTQKHVFQNKKKERVLGPLNGVSIEALNLKLLDII